MNPTSHSDFEPFAFKGAIDVEGCKHFLVWTASQDVSDIHVQGGNQLVVSRHGRLLNASTFKLADDQLAKLIDGVFSPEVRAQIRGGEPQDRPLQLDGDMHNRYGLGRGERIRFRCNFVQATAGKMDTTTALTMRVIPTDIPDLEKMGIEPDLFEALLPHKGLGLVGGETGSGKSTLLAAVYRYCADVFPDRKITTAEDPVEYIIALPKDVLPATQLQIRRDVKNYADALRAALRRAPSIIGIGEMRDLETMRAAIMAGQLGHLCLSTLHIHSPGEGISRMLAEFPHEIREAMARDLLGVLQYIVVQRLLRTTDGKRLAVREYVVIDDRLRDVLAGMDHTRWGHHIDAPIKHARGRIADKAFALYGAGRIDRAEMLTVVHPRQLRDMEATA